MALGQLVVKLSLDAAEFTSGLTKSEAQAKKFSKQMESSFASAAKFLASLGIGVAVGAFIKDTISAAAALDDLSDATGSSVEELSKLANQAKIAGADFSRLENLVLKLGVGISGIEDESADASRALKFLGVTTKDPAEALQQVAVALEKYTDGVGKLALAKALFGKEGPKELALLKDIANLQDVAATTTARQAQEAENLEKAWRRLGVEGTTLKNIILSDMVPATSKLLEQFTEGIRLAGGFFNAFRLFSTLPVVGNVGAATDALAKLNERIKTIEAGKGLEGITARLTGQTARIVADLKIQRDFLELQLSQQIGAAPGKKGGAADDLTVKPSAAFSLASPKAKTGVDEFGRALETARKMAAGARAELDSLAEGAEKLTSAQKALAVLQADDVWAKFSKTQRDQITAIYESASAYEKETEAIRKRREEFDKTIEALQRQAEEETKARERVRASVAEYTLQNEIFSRQIAIVGQGEVAHQKLAAAIEYERLRKEAVAALDLASVANLEKEYQARLKLIDAMEAANKQLEETLKQKKFIDDIGHAFGNAAEEALLAGKSFKDVLKGLEQDLLRIITRKLVTEPLANAISGFLGGSTGTGGLIGGFLGMLGSGGGSGYSLPAASAANLGGTFGYAGGTNYARGGWSMVGERGPEAMFVPRGAQIIPHETLVSKRAAKSMTIIQNITNMPGLSRQSAAQQRGDALRSAMQAQRFA